MTPKERKERLLNFLYELYRKIENTDLEDCSFEISRGIIKVDNEDGYITNEPDKESTVIIKYKAL